MADKTKPEMAPQQRTLKLSPALGDWTSYKPSRTLVKKIKVGLYGFDRLSDAELEDVHFIHYNFAENLLKNLKINFKFSGELYAVDEMQGTYSNFQKIVLGPLLQGKIDVPEFHDEIVFSFDMGLISTIINASMGTKDTKNLGAELTGAEKIILENAFDEFISSAIKQAFGTALDNPVFQATASPDYMPNINLIPSATFVYFIIEISFGETLGKILVGYPGNLLKSLLKKLKRDEKPKPLYLNKVKSDILNKTKIPVSVILGSTELKGSELYQLEAGDVVSLDNSIHNAIQIKIADTIILAQPGTKEGKLIVRVVGVEKEKEIKVAPPLPILPPELKEQEIPEEEIEETKEEDLREKEGIKEETEENELQEEEMPQEEEDEELEEFPEDEFEDLDLEDEKGKEEDEKEET